MNEKLKNEIQRYLDTDGIGARQVKEHLKKFRDKPTYDIPVCILSHKFDKRRSKFLVNLEKEVVENPVLHRYFIFTYADQKDLYSRFEKLQNVEVIYIPLIKNHLTLSGKRQYILDWNLYNQNSNAFFIEDDCYDFCLPIGAIGKESGNFRNNKFVMSLNLTFGLWEYLINTYNLKYSGPVNNMEFTFRNLDENPFIKPYSQTVQAVHINTVNCYKNKLYFDEESGWDDYDMIIQQCVYAEGSTAIIFSYNTPALKSGVSAMSATADALKERCIKNTNALIAKWGLGLVRLDTKKDLYNAKINWFTIKRAMRANVDLKRIIKLSNEESKKVIDSVEILTLEEFE